MTHSPERQYWRVGYHGNPAGFVPRELCTWNHRFDDADRRFRSIYVAERPHTALREVLADLRPNTEAIRRYVERFGPDAAHDIPAQPVTASWRDQHLLVAVHAETTGPVIDLCDSAVRHQVERRHAALLHEHGMRHLDLSEITSSRRAVTQTIAADLHDEEGAAGIRFPSRLDGEPCLALFEGRSKLIIADTPIGLADPAPTTLLDICAAWHLPLEPTDP